MWAQGFLDGRQMAGAFQILRSNDLIWSKLVHDYLMGERVPLTDLMAWNSDATRMPYRMHSEYLRKLFLDDDLAEGRYVADGRPVALADLRLPMFVVGTEQDHVAPWRSVYKIHLYAQGDITFLLASGGHNAGIVSEPGHPGRSYRVGAHNDNHYVDPDTWLATATAKPGSWWLEWAEWLDRQASGARPTRRRRPGPRSVGRSATRRGPTCWSSSGRRRDASGTRGFRRAAARRADCGRRSRPASRTSSPRRPRRALPAHARFRR